MSKKREEAKRLEEQFDIKRIGTALPDKRAPQRQVVTGSLVNPTPSLGSSTANAPQLSQNEIDMLRAQIQACWSPPVDVIKARDLVVVLQFGLNQDGSVSGEPFATNRSGSPLFQVAAESATRAVMPCQPYRLPVSKYEAWRDVEVKFDPQREAAQSLSTGKPQDIPQDQFVTVRRKCAGDWPDDFNMRAFCERQQFSAIRELSR